MKNEDKKELFKMIGEATTYFKISEERNEFLIEIRGEKKFKNIWIVKLNELQTNMEEVDFYNQE